MDLRLPASPAPVHPLQGEADAGALQRIRLPQGLVHDGEAGHVAAHRRRGLHAPHVIDEGDHGGGGGGKHRPDMLPAPGREDLYVRPQRAFRVARRNAEKLIHPTLKK